jgi:hypothetical protein
MRERSAVALAVPAQKLRAWSRSAVAAFAPAQKAWECRGQAAALMPKESE